MTVCPGRVTGAPCPGPGWRGSRGPADGGPPSLLASLTGDPQPRDGQVSAREASSAVSVAVPELRTSAGGGAGTATWSPLSPGPPRLSLPSFPRAGACVRVWTQLCGGSRRGGGQGEGSWAAAAGRRRGAGSFPPVPALPPPPSSLKTT